nr:MAG TPA: hypothetical protein [Bacteriophage sp.]
MDNKICAINVDRLPTPKGAICRGANKEPLSDSFLMAVSFCPYLKRPHNPQQTEVFTMV